MIERYFESICRIVIDEFNLLARGTTKEEKEEFVRLRVNEADLVIRLGSPFGPFARYVMQGPGPDIIIDHKDFLVEVKYWRYWPGGTGNQKRSFYESFQEDFDWLCSEIANGRKGDRAFIAGWSPLFTWNNLLRLGVSRGGNPFVNRAHLQLLPFLKVTNGRLSSVYTDYSAPEQPLEVTIQGIKLPVNWRLYGTGTDLLNLCMYW